MGYHDNRHDEDADDCGTTDSFSDHGIGDGTDLVTRTYNRLPEDDRRQFDPTDAFFARLESAFIWAYLGSTTDRGVPSHVEAALDDARMLTQEEFADHPDADLRTEVLPAFYRRFAAFHCAYRN